MDNPNEIMGILVLSGGITDDGLLPKYVKNRCDLAYDLYSKNNSIIVCSSSFTLNKKPHLSKDGFVCSESSLMSKYLKKMGVDRNNILCEQLSHDTIGSIFFSLEYYFFPRGISKLAIVTSDFHYLRSNCIASFINRVVFENKFSITFYQSPVEGDKTKRKVHENLATERFKTDFYPLSSRNSFLIKLFSEHINYNYRFSGRKVTSEEMY